MAGLRARFAPLLVAALLAGCGGGRAVGSATTARFTGDYTGSYALATSVRDASDGAIVLDVDPSGAAEGSVTVRGAVYDFKGRIGGDGLLAASGEGVVMTASLARTDAGDVHALVGSVALSGEVDVQAARTTLTRVATP